MARVGSCGVCCVQTRSYPFETNYDGQTDLTAFWLTVQQSEPGAGADVRVSGPAKTGTFTDAATAVLLPAPETSATGTVNLSASF